MDYLEQLCKMLHIKINEPFRIKGKDSWFRINNKGQIMWDAGTNQRDWYYDPNVLCRILNGSLTISEERFPKCEEIYYYPCPGTNDGINFEIWNNDDYDNNIKNRIGIYRTKEEAIEKARELGWVK